MVINMVNKNAENAKKTPKEFICELCDFKCSKKSNYNLHILTRKHKMVINDNKKSQKNAENAEKKLLPNQCECGKIYKHLSGLCRHRKKCTFQENEESDEISNEIIYLKQEKEEDEEEENKMVELKNDLSSRLKQNDEIIEKQTDLINKLIDQNSELNQTMREMIPKLGNTTNNNTNNNTNNFNLQIFLNEDCKDALNIMDFINSLQIQIEDLVTTGKLGFAESTSKMLIKGLNELEVTKRPIHCSDLKRETLYIKDNDVWEKETENKEKMTRAVKYLQKESFGVIPDWVKEHPGCARGDNKHNDEYMEIVGNTAGVDKVKDVNKIIKKVAKEVVIDKNKN